MPKQKITKKMVLDAAFCILRTYGEEQVLVKNIASQLSCSVQPIYSYCQNMDSLRQDLSQAAGDYMRNYVRQRLDPDNLFESTGKTYISFAKEEPHLFKSYFLRKREGIRSLDDLYAAEASGNMISYLTQNLQIPHAKAKELHMNMIIYSTGLSFMMISAGGNFSEEELHKNLMHAYQAFLGKAKNEGANNENTCNL